MSLPVLRRRQGFRLFDGVVVAALALLAIKVLGVLSPAPPSAAPVDALDDPGFARVLSHARTNFVPPDPPVTGSVPAKPPDPPPAPSPPTPAESKPLPTPPSESERALLERLGSHRDELQQRARDAELREKLLQEQERRIEERLSDLKAAEEKSPAAAGGAGKADDPSAGLKNIVTMYEAMKPKEAARVFDRLPQDVLVSVVLGMNPRKMAEVLAAMAPETAEKLTVALAKRGRPGTGGPAAAAAALAPGELPAIDAPVRRPGN